MEYLRGEGHQAWSAYEAHLEDASDGALVVYAADKGAIAVTTNKDFVALARRLRAARVVYLRCREPDALEMMARALGWLDQNRLPPGRVLRVPRRADVRVMTPLAD